MTLRKSRKSFASNALKKDIKRNWKRNLNRLHKNKLVPEIYTNEDIDAVIDYLCLIGKHTKIYYLWRPHLKDAFDDHVLEVALSSGVSYIVTHNIKDFVNIKEMGITAITPRDFLLLLEEGTP